MPGLAARRSGVELCDSANPEFTREEVALALRNPGMPLEALRYPVTPIGMHYVLIHFDVPAIDAASYDLRVDGRVRAPLVLTLEDLRSRPGFRCR